MFGVSEPVWDDTHYFNFYKESITEYYKFNIYFPDLHTWPVVFFSTHSLGRKNWNICKKKKVLKKKYCLSDYLSIKN